MKKLFYLDKGSGGYRPIEEVVELSDNLSDYEKQQALVNWVMKQVDAQIFEVEEGDE